MSTGLDDVERVRERRCDLQDHMRQSKPRREQKRESRTIPLPAPLTNAIVNSSHTLRSSVLSPIPFPPVKLRLIPSYPAQYIPLNGTSLHSVGGSPRHALFHPPFARNVLEISVTVVLLVEDCKRVRRSSSGETSAATTVLDSDPATSGTQVRYVVRSCRSSGRRPNPSSRWGTYAQGGACSNAVRRP